MTGLELVIRSEGDGDDPSQEQYRVLGIGQYPGARKNDNYFVVPRDKDAAYIGYPPRSEKTDSGVPH